jgi:hypothetical protein
MLELTGRSMLVTFQPFSLPSLSHPHEEWNHEVVAQAVELDALAVFDHLRTLTLIRGRGKTSNDECNAVR